ncbi:hypothetical protein [Pseudosporangium ferrugineum]|uniref:Uncharacterized protein n=1 Tax=Pseudosporangium ferrugineum TaxID=439699 RepID=A0A2T0S3T3_9ACTN|nr:hypothetical protein [Pseudosporangium ferrugineum]PRY28070.1 hypothetical protein CLV70_109227 [Pseudosporangium ferrugineum]
MTTYRYRLLLGSWGISIDFVAEARPAEHGVQVTWDFDGPALDEEQMAAISAGIALRSAEILAATGGRPVDVVVRSVRYPETDYQVEGLTAAAAGWAVEHFCLPPGPPAVSFDRSRNRYVFEWPEPGR